MMECEEYVKPAHCGTFRETLSVYSDHVVKLIQKRRHRGRNEKDGAIYFA